MDVAARLRPDLELEPDTALLSTWDDDPWVRGAYYGALAAGLARGSRRYAARSGASVFAGEHTAGAWHGLMEGALRSGQRAARDLLI